MNYVYLIRGTSEPTKIYTSATADLQQRTADHDSGKSAHTSKFVPSEIACYLGFPGKQRAYEFEKYLKSHSGRAFARKRLIGRSDQWEAASRWCGEAEDSTGSTFVLYLT